MPKPRRQSEIRAAALGKAAALREAAETRAAFLKPRPRSWHDVFLAALKSGRPVSAAARAAGVSRSGAYKARVTEPGFGAAWDAASADAWAGERQRRAAARRDHWRTRIAAPSPTAQRRDGTSQRAIAPLGQREPGPPKVDNVGPRTPALAPSRNPRYREAS